MNKYNSLYRIFSSTKTAIILFIILLVFYLIGSILPYKGDYNNITATGTLLIIIKGLDLLNVYSGPWFLILSAVFFANLIICTYHRLVHILKESQPVRLSTAFFSNQSNIVKMTLNGNFTEISEKTESFFRRRFYRRKPSAVVGDNIHGNVFVNGLFNPSWISIFYHFSIVLTLIGCTITFLFAFEGEVTIFSDKPSEVSLVSKNTNWYKCVNSVRSWFGKTEPAQKEWIVPDDKKLIFSLKDFEIKYTQRPKLKDYPRSGFIPRMNQIWNIQKLSTNENHEEKVFSAWLFKLIGNIAKTLSGTQETHKLSVFSPEYTFFPIKYISHLTLQEHERPTRKIDIEVNSPLRHRGITLYQSAYDYKFDIFINGKKVDINEDGKFKVDGIDGTFEKGDVIKGTFYKKNGTTPEIKPFVRLYYTPTVSDNKLPSKKEDLGRFEDGQGKDTKGVKVTLKNITAGTVLSYRHDPGLKLLWAAAPMFFFGMLYRAWGRWYTVYYLIEKADQNVNLYLRMQKKGIWADENRIVRTLTKKLTF